MTETRTFVDEELAQVVGMTSDEAIADLDRRVEIAKAGRDARLGDKTVSAVGHELARKIARHPSADVADYWRVQIADAIGQGARGLAAFLRDLEAWLYDRDKERERAAELDRTLGRRPR